MLFYMVLIKELVNCYSWILSYMKKIVKNYGPNFKLGKIYLCILLLQYDFMHEKFDLNKNYKKIIPFEKKIFQKC